VLYVTNNTNNRITIYNKVSRGSLDLSPNRIICPETPNAPLDSPKGAVVDTTRNIIYITNGTKISAFQNANTINGNVSASSEITYHTIGTLWGMFHDTANDRLYITNVMASTPQSSHILVYNNVSTKFRPSRSRTTVTPDRDIYINTGAVGTNCNHIMIDQAKDLAYLTDDSNVCIYVLENISTINGTVTPSRTIKVNNNELDGCKGLGVENDKLYVCSTIGGSIIVIGNASTASGSVDPERIITASDGLFNGPVAIALDPINKMMYVSNRSNDKVFAFKNYSSLNGTVTPAYYIYGDSTQLKTPVYLFVDPTRDN
jgi:hypothetical protein